MESRPKGFMAFFILILILQSYLMSLSHAQSIIRSLPGYNGDLPFKLETGYIGIGEKEDIQLFYYFVESTKNPKKDPLILYIQGGPGASGLITIFHELGPLLCVLDSSDNPILVSNPNAWTQMANIIFADISAGTGFSYAETKEGWISSDNILATQANEFLKKFLIDHPKFLKNSLYIAGISYAGIVVPKVTLEIYEGNERGDQPTLNIQGYILISPLTDKFKDFNSRFEYAYHTALISDDIYKSGIQNCQGNYVNNDKTNLLCAKSLQQYEECTSRIDFYNILERFCDDNDSTCNDEYNKLDVWANDADVQKALNVRQGKIGKFELINKTIHYDEGKNDTFCYSYDIFSSFVYHKKLTNRNCQALILSGDQDMTFPHIGIEQWITSLNLGVEIPWKPYYVDGQIGGYKMKYAENDYSLTYATVKGAGHVVSSLKPNETIALAERWFSSQIYSSDS